MNLLHIKFILSLCVTLCAIQEGVAFSYTAEYFSSEKSLLGATADSGHIFVYFDQSGDLKTELATKHKIPVIYGAVTSKVSMLVKWGQANSSHSTLFLRDQKRGIKILIFPFHSFW